METTDNRNFRWCLLLLLSCLLGIFSFLICFFRRRTYFFLFCFSRSWTWNLGLSVCVATGSLSEEELLVLLISLRLHGAVEDLLLVSDARCRASHLHHWVHAVSWLHLCYFAFSAWLDSQALLSLEIVASKFTGLLSGSYDRAVILFKDSICSLLLSSLLGNSELFRVVLSLLVKIQSLLWATAHLFCSRVIELALKPWGSLDSRAKVFVEHIIFERLFLCKLRLIHSICVIRNLLVCTRRRKRFVLVHPWYVTTWTLQSWKHWLRTMSWVRNCLIICSQAWDLRKETLLSGSTEGHVIFCRDHLIREFDSTNCCGTGNAILIEMPVTFWILNEESHVHPSRLSIDAAVSLNLRCLCRQNIGIL